MARGKVAQGTRAPKKRAEQPVSEGIRRAAARSGIVQRDAKPRAASRPSKTPRASKRELKSRVEKISERNERRAAAAELVVARHGTPAVTRTEKAVVEAAKLAEELQVLHAALFGEGNRPEGNARGALWRRVGKLEARVAFHQTAALRGTESSRRASYYHPTPGDAVRIALHGCDRFHPSRITEGVCANVAHEARLLIPAIQKLVTQTRDFAAMKVPDNTRLQASILSSLEALATRAELAHRIYMDVEQANIAVFTPQK